MKTNIRLISFPLFVCLLIFIIQTWIDNELDKPSLKCGCTCADTNADGKCTRKVCGVEYSTVDQVGTCSVPRPSAWVPLLQIPAPEYRAVNTKFFRSNDLPKESCRRLGSCPGTILLTGNNATFGRSLGANMFTKSFALDSSDATGSLANNLVGSPSSPKADNFYEPGFASSLPLYYAQSQCTSRPNFSVPILLASTSISKELRCVRGIHLWRNSSSEVNEDLYKGFRKGNTKGMINEMVAAYDFLNSNSNNFNASVWYNSTYNNAKNLAAIRLLRVPRSVNLVSNAYLQFLKGAGTKMLLNFVKETPKVETPLRVDFSAILGPVFFTWVILQLFPVILASLVYEKEQNLRIMMKMHGLGDGPYWMISYFYFLVVSTIYMLCFVVFGSFVDLKIFTLNDYVIQLVFYFIFINLQIALAFLAAAMFSNVRTATVIAYIFVFGTGLLGGFLFHFFIQDITFPGGWITVMQLYPGFPLYRGLYEFAQYSYTGTLMGTNGMRWVNLSDGENGMKDVLIIMVVEWAVVLVVAFYIEQVLSSGRNPLFFVHNLRKKEPLSSFRKPSFRRQGCKVTAQTEIEKLDVIQEKEKVEQLLLELNSSHAIVCNNLMKVYPGKDGNPAKFAVKGLSLALPHGECFGMLGPNGAGKTSLLMIGLTKPSCGMALVNGLDIRTDMDSIYTRMGVCPQHDLLWETLTGREHLLFYGRLKNLKGAALIQAVEESLDSVNLLYGGVGDKQAGKYSGGMKRRLSVAISLIGDPRVVYMDEPSTGLDPASRNNLWNVIKRAKQGRAIILTTHSMEEAEVLCDRLGIFVDGNLQCIGNAKELKARYGGSYVLTVTTSADHDMDVEILARSLSLDAKRIYHIPGTQKFELPKHEVRIADVFQSVENAKSWFPVYAWGLADTTLEDVFIKVVHSSQAFSDLS